MLTRTLAISLSEDCVFSQQSATEGGHKSLDYIPGSALLGAAANHLYNSLSSEDAFTVFHSGKVRFGNGLPSTGSSVGWPVPHSWHVEKQYLHDIEAGVEKSKGVLESAKIFNFITKHQSNKKTLRQGYITQEGKYIKPKHELRLKTAIDASTGRASESQLFGYDALSKSQSFISMLEADVDVRPDLFSRVLEALTQTNLLGRSRSAEYGQVEIELIENEIKTEPAIENQKQLSLWLLSDLAINDSQGNPTLTPTGDTFGLPEASVDWTRTFIRSRRYSPWNAKRHGFEHERLVLEAGGVITLSIDDAAAIFEGAEAIPSSFGLFREAGLGRVWVAPALLQHEHPEFSSTKESVVEPPLPEMPDDPLIQWLIDTTAIDWKAEADNKARAFEKTYLDLIKNARALNGISSHLPYGPSRSQWGAVSEKAKALTGEQLKKALFDTKNGVIKEETDGWKIEVIDNQNNYLTLARWLEQRISQQDFPEKNRSKSLARFIQHLSRRIQDSIDTRGC